MKVSELAQDMLRFRAEHSLSMSQAAKMANITMQTWYQIETGIQNPSRLTKEKIRLAMMATNMEKEED